MTTYETVSGDDSEKSEDEQITGRNDEPERFLDKDDGSQNESQQDLDVLTGSGSRMRRPLLQFGEDEFISQNT